MTKVATVKSKAAPNKTKAAPKKSKVAPKKSKVATVKSKAVPKKTKVVTVKSKAAPQSTKAKAKPKAALKATPKRTKAKTRNPSARLLALIETILDDGKAEDIFVIDLAGKSAMADFMVIATGGSHRQISALSHRLRRGIKTAKFGTPGVEGLSQGDWVLLDAGDVIVHLFRPEVRAFYNLEKMWGMALPDDGQHAVLGG